MYDGTLSFAGVGSYLGKDGHWVGEKYSVAD
jgi:hypothetical protein